MLDLYEFVHAVYQFPPYCSFIPLKDIDQQEVPKEQMQQIVNGELFLIYNALEKRILQINPTIKTFLESFQEPQSLKYVVKSFAEELNEDPSEIVENMANFMLEMLQSGLIVEHQEEQKKTDTEQWNEFYESNLSVNSVFHECKITEVLVQNPNTEIYIGEHLPTEEKVIIKMLRLSPKDLGEKQELKKQKFYQEFSIQQKLNDFDPVCKVLKLEMDEKQPFAILEYIEGQDLKEYILEHPNLPLESKLNLITQLLEIIAKLHQYEILHGDLHYHNFLITNQLQVKVIDFGFANNANPNQDEFVHEGGLLRFIPPERLNKNAFRVVKSKSEYASEVFQLGVLIYFVLYAEMPFVGFTWKALANEIETKEPVFETQVNGEPIPETILLNVEKSLNKNPENRHVNAIEFYNEIKDLWVKSLKLQK